MALLIRGPTMEVLEWEAWAGKPKDGKLWSETGMVEIKKLEPRLFW